MSMNKSSDTIGNRTCGFLICSALPQATAPPRAPIVDQYRTQMKIWRMHILYWIPKVASIHSEYVTLIYFPLQQLLRERAYLLVLRTFPVLFTTYFTALSIHKSVHFAPHGNTIRDRFTRQSFPRSSSLL
jgi:hypothetical protein